MSTATYAFAGDKPERLAGIEVTWDPGTIERLQALGVAPGWRCLEAGAGGGSIAAWLADRVGPDGLVVATDLETTFLEPLAGENLEVRRHDLLRDELPAGTFDLVHARLLLEWLGSGDALERLVAAVAPGGWLLLEDFDWAIGGPGEDAPPATGVVYGAVIRLLESIGYQPYYGRTLPRRMEGAGLQDVGNASRSYVVRGGSAGTAFERLSIEAHREKLLAAGGLTGTQLDVALDALADPGQDVLTPMMFAAWGRRRG